MTSLQWHPRIAIREAMLQDNVSQGELAAQLGWSQSKVSRHLSGDQDIKWRELLAYAKAQDRPLSFYIDAPNYVKGDYLSWDFAGAA